MKNLKAINNNLSHEEKSSLLTEFLTMSEGAKDNMRNYLISKDLIKFLDMANNGVLAYKILCMVAIKNK